MGTPNPTNTTVTWMVKILPNVNVTGYIPSKLKSVDITIRSIKVLPSIQIISKFAVIPFTRVQLSGIRSLP